MGPPSHPATFVDYDLSADGRITYFMTGPEGEKFHGRWRVEDVEPPNRLRFADDDTDDEGEPSDGGPTEMTVTIAALDGTTTMSIGSRFASRETMEQMIEMGMEQGFTETLGQIDRLLADVGG
ncbi:MAG: SRPBCC family protein [Solirubrobacterales bacterium]